MMKSVRLLQLMVEERYCEEECDHSSVPRGPPRKHMLPYQGLVPHARLVKERQKLEINLEQYFRQLPGVEFRLNR